MTNATLASGATILVVDDSLLVLDIIRDALEGRGYRVATTDAPLDCKRMLEEFEPDVLVVDIEMPVLDGPELLRLVRRRSTHACIVLLFSDRSQEELAATVLACGADGGAQKTPDCGELIAVLERELAVRPR
ncbi:response regulator [Enhygromyxa salina]|uniref:Transcriptional regulatory protein YycF n=1 Tax=Enhygromyxa salina TaxID=215803 RepID=A0A2S9XQV1_9BACT|nr:response regulator [Enhygromyxa salina]PRP95248.1 Transcriptional regulatory protein YycF [Enhygromyxa salina]